MYNLNKCIAKIETLCFSFLLLIICWSFIVALSGCSKGEKVYSVSAVSAKPPAPTPSPVIDSQTQMAPSPPSAATSPMTPTSPTTPTDPTIPTGPTSPTTPTDPTIPPGPTSPTTPTDPTTPPGPTSPTTPTDPTIPPVEPKGVYCPDGKDPIDKPVCENKKYFLHHLCSEAEPVHALPCPALCTHLAKGDKLISEAEYNCRKSFKSSRGPKKSPAASKSIAELKTNALENAAEDEACSAL